MSYEFETEAAKVVRFRNMVFAENQNERVVRRRIEQRLIQRFEESKNYQRHLKRGRLDLIDPETRSHIFMPIDQIQELYENYYTEIERQNTLSNLNNLKKNSSIHAREPAKRQKIQDMRDPVNQRLAPTSSGTLPSHPALTSSQPLSPPPSISFAPQMNPFLMIPPPPQSMNQTAAPYQWQPMYPYQNYGPPPPLPNGGAQPISSGPPPPPPLQGYQQLPAFYYKGGYEPHLQRPQILHEQNNENQRISYDEESPGDVMDLNPQQATRNDDRPLMPY